VSTNSAHTSLVGAWARWAVRYRWPVAIVWLAVVVVGGWASGRLSSLQSNVFTVPGTDSERVRGVLQQHFGDRSDGAFTVVFHVPNSADTGTQARLQALIGIGIAIDYSLLIVYRFREELSHGLGVEAAVLRTMETAGRAVIVSGATVAIGLALLLFMPLPFMRAMGVGGFLIPIVSILAAATLQPALLAIYGRRGTHRVAVAAFLRSRAHVPVRGSAQSDDVEHRFWARLAGSIMRRKWLYALAVGALLVVVTVPVAWLQLTPGATAGIPQSPPSVRGLRVLEEAVGPGAIAPAQVLLPGGRRRACRRWPAAGGRLSAPCLRRISPARARRAHAHVSPADARFPLDRRDLPRCDPRARHPRPRADGDHGPLQLMAACSARPPRPRPALAASGGLIRGVVESRPWPPRPV
jgi:uncharacterized membrane protein YdfJ with MMPL/SSD domain